MSDARPSARQRHGFLRAVASARLAVHLAVGVIAGAPSLMWPLAAHGQATQARDYDIPAGTLEDALGRFGREAGIVLSFRPDVTADLHSDGLRGSHTVRGGLDALLEGSGIRVLPQSSESYVLERPPVMEIGTTQLPAVTITGSDYGLPWAYAGGQIARGGGLGVLGASDVMDTPFSTINYTAQTLENQQARTLADVVINDSSVRTLTASGGFSEDFQIRGYAVSSGDVGLNGLYGLASSSRMPAAMMERVEVLKGPGTLMNGIGPDGSVGGGINIVTKRASDEPLTRLTVTYQDTSQLGSQLDMGRRFGGDNAWGIRVNGVYRNGATAIDDGRQQQGVGVLALDYGGQKLRWSLDAYTQHETDQNVRPQVGFQSSLTSLPSPPSGHRNFFPGTQLKLDDSAVATRLEYDISDAITVFGAAGYRYGRAQQTLPSGPVDQQGNFTALNAYYDSYSHTKTGDVGIRARFFTWGVKHAVSLGATRLDQETGNGYVTSGTTISSNIYRPARLPEISAQRPSPAKASSTELSSYTLTDTLSFADDRLIVIGGLRKQRVVANNYAVATGGLASSYDDRAMAPLAGIVFKPVSNVSVYGNFTSGLTRGGMAPSTAANAGQVFAPYKAKQYEAGVKVDWGQILTSASVFQIKQPNAVTDPATNRYSADDEQRNRGLELAVYGEATRSLRMMASATFYDATLTRTAGGVNDGNAASGVPKNTFNLGVDWDMPWVRGLSLSARVIHTASAYFNASNTLTLPAWTRYDIGAGYSTGILGRTVVFRANVENLFNKDYWLLSGNYATVAAPRTVLLSAQIDF